MAGGLKGQRTFFFPHLRAGALRSPPVGSPSATPFCGSPRPGGPPLQLTWGAGGRSNSRAPTQVHSLAAGALSRALAEVTKQGQGQPWVQVQSRPKKAFRPVAVLRPVLTRQNPGSTLFSLLSPGRGLCGSDPSLMPSSPLLCTACDIPFPSKVILPEPGPPAPRRVNLMHEAAEASPRPSEEKEGSLQTQQLCYAHWR